jgi:hypothetical protein
LTLKHTPVLKWKKAGALFGEMALPLATQIFIVTQQTVLKLTMILQLVENFQ